MTLLQRDVAVDLKKSHLERSLVPGRQAKPCAGPRSRKWATSPACWTFSRVLHQQQQQLERRVVQISRRLLSRQRRPLRRFRGRGSWELNEDLIDS